MASDGTSKSKVKSQLEHLLASLSTRYTKVDASYSRKLPPALESMPIRAATYGQHTGSSSTALTIGLVDLPALQEQRPFVVDLARGGLAIVGPPASGRTTTLLTCAEAFQAAIGPDASFGLVAIDGGSQLSDMVRSCFDGASVFATTDVDDLTRCIDQLLLIMYSRKARSGLSSTLAPAAELPLLLLIDGYDILSRTFSTSALALAFSKLQELLLEGRRYGIYHCVTSQSERDFGPALSAMQSDIIYLHRHYEEIATPADQRLPGFGLDKRNALVQVFFPHARSRPDTAAADQQLVEFLHPNGWRLASTVASAPENPGMWCAIGVHEVERVMFYVDLSNSHILVIGPPKSGRTSILCQLARQAAERLGSRVAVIYPRAHEHLRFDPTFTVPVNGDMLRELKTTDQSGRQEIQHRLGLASLPDGRLPIFVDDCYAIESMPGGSGINNDLASLQRESAIQPVAVTTGSWVGGSSLTTAMKTSGVTIYVRPTAGSSDMDDGYRVRGMNLRHRPGMTYIAGDAIVQTEERQFVVHLYRSSKVQNHVR